MARGSDPSAPAGRLPGERVAAVTRLRARREEFRRLVDAAGSTTLDDEHDPEGATIAFERGQLAALVDRAEQGLRDIDDAIARVADGTYGVCPACGRAIAADRLDARPAAVTCIDCADARRSRQRRPR